MVLEISQKRTQEIIDKAAHFIVERKMAAPAIMMIESLRPLHRIGSQIMYFIEPFAEIIFNQKEYQEFAVLLEDQNNVKALMSRIDELDIELHAEERKQKRLLRKRKIKKLKNFLKKNKSQ